MLADVAQELEHPHGAEPVVVVDDERLAATRAEVEEVFELDLDRGGVRDHLLARQQVALGGSTRRVADHARAAADDDDRTAPMTLDVHQPEHRDEVPDVERGATRIEPVVGIDRPAGGQAGGESGRLILEQPAPVELGQQAVRIGAAGRRTRSGARHRRRARRV